MALPEQCPQCRADIAHQTVVTNRVYGDNTGKAFFRCAKCSVIYLYPPLTAEQADQFYADEFSAFMEKRAGTGGGWKDPRDHVRSNQSQFERRMAYATPRLPASGRVLEMGCSSGFMLYPLAEKGYHCVGVEPSGAFCEFVQEREISCFQSWEQFTQSAEAAAPFDLIMHFFVLEHVLDPKTFLETQLDYLKPGGLLIFEVPCAEDALSTLYDLPAFERFYWSLAHNWYFNEASLANLLDDSGMPYDILRDQRYDLSNHMTWAMDGKPGGAGRFTPVWGIDVENAYREALIKAGHFDTLVGIIEKK